MTKRKPNFKGLATAYGVLCTDGRTIKADAFAHEDKRQLQLLWRHDDKTPSNVLGHVILEHESGRGVHAHAYFNKSENGQNMREAVENGDIDMLSIKAVRLRQDGTFVTHGDLTEVSLVPTGANKEARIESVYIEHGDGDVTEIEDQGIIYSGFTLMHEDDDSDDDDDDSDEDDSDDSDDGMTVQEVYDTMNDDQKAVVEVLVDAASTAKHESPEDGENLNHEGESPMGTRNVFDQSSDSNKPEGSVLTHEQVQNIFESAKANGGVTSFKDHVLEHAAQYGITNIEALFPDAKPTTTTPQWIKRDDSWVAGVLGGVTRSPMSKIKSWTADVTHEEARAKGYITGEKKKDEYYAVAQRETTPQTIYKKQKLDRDNIIDVSTFDVVSWLKEEMRWMLQEETARAILFGDGRDPGDPDKIRTANIRPIAYDDDFYTTKVMVNANLATKTLSNKILRSRKHLKGGSGKPTLYTNDDLIIDMLLMEDQLGRRYYDTEQALAGALGVKNIVECDVLDEGYVDDDGNTLLGVLVNIGDYTVGADKGGQTSLFDDFDIDFNQFKYLIEHRMSGALTKHHSAVSLWTTSAVRVVPEEPELTDINTITIPTQANVEFFNVTLGDEEDISGTDVVITEGTSPVTIKAVPVSGYRFPMNLTTTWTFSWTDEA